MIAKGDITDSSPNSVYAHFLLSSGPVFPKLHPLLASGVTESANCMESPKTYPMRDHHRTFHVTGEAGDSFRSPHVDLRSGRSTSKDIGDAAELDVAPAMKFTNRT